MQQYNDYTFSAPMLDEKLELVTEVGKGGQGLVFLVRDRETHEEFAAKIIKPDSKSPTSMKEPYLKREWQAHQDCCDHPNIVQSVRYSQCSKASSLKTEDKQTESFHLMEYAPNDTLISYVKHSGGFREDLAQFYFLQIAYATEHIHNKGYAHMDLKLNNIFLDQFFNIRIGDFGSALKVDKNGLTKRKRGTPNYMAPEVKNHTGSESFDPQKADVYSLGICLYILLFKSFPKYKSDDCSTDGSATDSNPEDLPNPFIISNHRWASKS
jgi:serine/threonine protein kinase